MVDQDDDKVELAAAREALHTAQIDAVKADAAVASIQQTRAEIQAIVDRNGYVDRFRQMLRGVA